MILIYDASPRITYRPGCSAFSFAHLALLCDASPLGLQLHSLAARSSYPAASRHWGLLLLKGLDLCITLGFQGPTPRHNHTEAYLFSLAELNIQDITNNPSGYRFRPIELG